MKKIVLLFPVLLLSVSCMQFVRFASANPGFIRVPQDYEKIQWAVGNASVGDTILVSSGVYYEHVTINKTVKLLGENKITTIIDGNGTDIVVKASGEQVWISGFTIQNGGPVGKSVDMPGIILLNCTITDNIIRYNPTGIQALGCVIVGNEVSNNERGISLWFNGSIVADNRIFNNSLGISIQESSCNVLSRNILENNGECFLVFGQETQHFIHNIDTSNLIDGKPVYYLIDQHDMQVPENAGYVAIINSTNIIVKSLALTNSHILLVNTNNSKVENVNFTRYPVSTYYHWGWDIFYPTPDVCLYSSSNNTFYHNNFMNETERVYAPWSDEPYGGSEYANFWDNGFEGNYWCDYDGVDFYTGIYQNETGSDGIGDTPYSIEGLTISFQDNYPLMGPFRDFEATSEYHVQTVCNSSISDFEFNGTAIYFNATGEDDTTGFCRICIPKALMNETYRVYVNDIEVQYNLLPCSDTTHSYLYFTYNHSTQEVIVIPEYLTWTPILILIVLTVVIVIYKRRLLKTPIQ